MKNFMNVEILVGDKKIHSITNQPYNKNILNFLDDLSKNLMKLKEIENYPDISAVAFFCRKANLMNQKKIFFKNKEFRIGLGLIFHIAPSNVPVNFLYSLVFGLITGNSNIVKVPSFKFAQIEIICNIINKLLKKKHKNLKKFIKVLRYEKENINFTNFISSECDARLIWGGDKSINEIRKFSVKPRSIDLTFADRYSICIINAGKFLKLNHIKKITLLNQFYNDTFTLDQNACSSPHLILWMGNKVKKAKDVFWSHLAKISKKKYQFIESSVVEKYTQVCKRLMQNDNIKNYKFFDNTLSTLTVKKLNKDILSYRGRWGYFFEYDLKSLSDIKDISSKKIQTVTYYGINSQLIKNTILKLSLPGFDRIVPIGQALELDFIWDGYDINKTLTRIIDVK
jgi:hypothetical protein